MGSRKEQSFYFPPGMDPANVPREKTKGRRGGRGAKRPKQTKVRLAMPFTALCGACGSLIGFNKRFIARKETVIGEDYLGVPVHRFYCKCPECASEFTIKTDPKTASYVAEHRVKRLHEAATAATAVKPLREMVDDDADGGGDGDGGGDPMAALEQRAADTRREMEDLERLEDLRAINAQLNDVDPMALLAARAADAEALAAAAASDTLDEADEQRMREIFAARAARVIRLDDRSPPVGDAGEPSLGLGPAATPDANPVNVRTAVGGSAVGKRPRPRGSVVVRAVKRAKLNPKATPAPVSAAAPAPAPTPAPVSLLAGYGDSDSDSSS
ncbi:coiled-coil domain-containing protein 94 [Thecamonas trahens ATCC 50062]|uniref:Coiled-coil domain-containing protein 94 n=1 Tax=Thecamonas trahens ATCC 50062 TaxID=461836 RepID=A0A0L0DIP5_THETB|nr:coiled-coil domain-containing protein 94 [Thecamonas trahens ATCC 50062]KNC52167.1 coiled-coil domain-containing protein 94 [Thecamonas trahens ATCC 50062]|eukprot:XP_013762170.1 coiled-coil domain-containing protein 94 [Thecamonas trahens ATCC 50062]